LDINQLDAISAFTNITLDEIVYYRILEGFYVLGKYLLLNKALYSLARVPRLWFKNLSSILLSIGFRQILDASCFFTSRVIIVFFYIDDITIFNRKENRAITKKFKADLYQKYKLKDKEELK
jgi:predicted GNAT superfamily acetyltransferase